MQERRAAARKQSRAAAARIRRATWADVETLAAFSRRMALETERKTLPVQVIRRGVAAVFDEPARGFYLLAEVGDEAVGTLMITREWSDWRCGEFWWIQSVYVTRAWRRRGLYRALYAHVRELAAQAQNVCGFRLYVERENHTAQATYAALGMAETHYKMFEAKGGM